MTVPATEHERSPHAASKPDGGPVGAKQRRSATGEHHPFDGDISLEAPSELGEGEDRSSYCFQLSSDGW